MTHHLMLQIVTKQYFRPGVPLHETLHRQVLHTTGCSCGPTQSSCRWDAYCRPTEPARCHR
jgi:hypothetical protein